MTERNTGGPAFPQNTKIMLPAGQEVHQGFMGGMTLRDYFAAKAMQAIYTSSFKWEPTGRPRDLQGRAVMAELAVDAYGIADAMLEARK